MDHARAIHRRLLSAHAKSLELHPNERLVHMAFFEGHAAPEAAVLLLMTQDDVLRRFDRDAELVRWLLHQMTTYDTDRQAILACCFDERTVLSDVLWLRDARTRAADPAPAAC